MKQFHTANTSPESVVPMTCAHSSITLLHWRSIFELSTGDRENKYQNRKRALRSRVAGLNEVDAK